MHPAVATLQKAARRLQHSGNIDPSKFAWMMSQLHGVTAELDASERKARNQKSDPVDITELLREVLAKAGIAMQLSDTTMVSGPDQSLRDLLTCLIEVALGARPNALDLHAKADRKCDNAREAFTIQVGHSITRRPRFSPPEIVGSGARAGWGSFHRRRIGLLQDQIQSSDRTSAGCPRLSAKAAHSRGLPGQRGGRSESFRSEFFRPKSFRSESFR